MLVHKSLAACLACAVLLLITGCKPEGPARYNLSGSITYQGQPVRGGEIHFTPDNSKNNSGPGSYAAIRHGRFETLPGKGTVGGPHVLTIICFRDIPGEVPEDQLKELCPPQELRLDLPTVDGTRDLVLPSP